VNPLPNDDADDVILNACKELIDDAKEACVDLVFKEICLEIFARADLVLTTDNFIKLREYAAQKINEGKKKPKPNP